jgi:hypothetical protein
MQHRATIVERTLIENGMVKLFCLIDVTFRQGYFYVDTIMGDQRNFHSLNEAIAHFDLRTAELRQKAMELVEESSRHVVPVVGRHRGRLG